MKLWTVLVGVKLQPDQHPETPVIHKVGGYGSGSDIDIDQQPYLKEF
jgi:hypothetical protein